MLCGLEIHQRLSGPKLFCSCPAPLPDEALEPSALHLVRRMQAASGEGGAVDVAAAFEAGRERRMDYTAPHNSTCLVEADEEPPHEMSQVHLEAVLALAYHANAEIVDEVQVMRKTVADGSNTSGFQRTSLVALGGALPSSNGPIPLETICLEEESAGILPALEGRTAYRIDRLGVALIEIATAPVFTTPASAQVGAEAIGMALRMLPNTMRGLGTIRQDVNVSIPGGARVEIKGLQDIRILPLLIENEVKRQEGLIEISAEMKKWGMEARTSAPLVSVDVSSLFSSTSCPIILRAKASGGVVLAARLPKMAGLMGKTFYEGRRFGSELSDYAKMAGGVQGLIHSDEDLSKYKFSAQELSALRARLQIEAEDAFILIADSKAKAETAIRAALDRALISGVPKETRKADEKGGSSFMRPMAGAHRMYPETDIPPIRITEEMLRQAADCKIETVQERTARLHALLGPDLGGQMLRSRQFPLFERLISGDGKAALDPKLVAITLEQTLVTLRREGMEVEKIEEKKLGEVLRLAQEEKITRAVISEVLKEIAKDPTASPSSIVSTHHWQRLSGVSLEQAFSSSGGDMKSFMAKYRLVADGADVAKLVKSKKPS